MIIESCKEYIKSITRDREVGIFEFGINAYFLDGILVMGDDRKQDGVVFENLRLDALLVDCSKEYIRGFEFKSSRSDFLSDKKWYKYLKYCNTFSFVCEEGTINKGELPAGIGLIYVKKRVKGYSFQPFNRVHNCKKREVEREIYVSIISKMLLKAKYRQSDIF